MNVNDPETFRDVEMYSSDCGATSSKLKLRFDLVPETFNIRVAQRYTEGAEKHGQYNYRKGLTDPKYLQERIAHLRQHLSSFLTEGNQNDDNLAAIAWCCAFLMEAEMIPAGKKALEIALNTMNYKQMKVTHYDTSVLSIQEMMDDIK